MHKYFIISPYVLCIAFILLLYVERKEAEEVKQQYINELKVVTTKYKTLEDNYTDMKKNLETERKKTERVVENFLDVLEKMKDKN